MPSCFLETFGLSALEMASFSIPTLGFMKGGLSQFLLPELSLLDSTERASSIASLMQRIVLQDEYYFADLKHRTHTIADRYTSRHFLDIFWGVFPTKKRVLFIADYVSIIGWLEKTTSMFIRTLSESWISTRLLWAPGESQWLRLKNMMMSVGNIFWAKKIWQEINEYRPDLVWIQSMHRVWWFLWVHIVLQHGISAVAMHHDFGIITPFSQDVEAIADIPKTWSLIDFYRCLKRPTLWKKIFLFYKFILLSLYRTQIRQIKEHFVPSEFMIEPFSRLLWISRDRFRVMPLFTEGASHTE